jgi:Fe-S-cluster containining protein
MTEAQACREGCGACCVVPGIVQPFYGMPEGKPVGVRCIHLTSSLGCSLFNDPRRPSVCTNFMPQPDVCGDSRDEAMALVTLLDKASQPEI